MTFDGFLKLLHAERRRQWVFSGSGKLRTRIGFDCPLTVVANRRMGYRRFHNGDPQTSGQYLGLDAQTVAAIIMAADHRTDTEWRHRLIGALWRRA